MAESIKQRAKALRDGQRAEEDMTKLLNAMRADLANLRASIVGITAKLDADIGVTDTNYAALHNPVALNTNL